MEQLHNTRTVRILLICAIDFGIPAEWHIFATSRGKGDCDEVGGTVKRMAAGASLQRPYEKQMMTPRQLYNWVSENINATFFGYCTIEKYETELVAFQERFEKKLNDSWHMKNAFIHSMVHRNS